MYQLLLDLMVFREQALRLILDLSSTVITLLVSLNIVALLQCELLWCYKDLENWFVHLTLYEMHLALVLHSSLKFSGLHHWRAPVLVRQRNRESHKIFLKNHSVFMNYECFWNTNVSSVLLSKLHRFFTVQYMC